MFLPDSRSRLVHKDVSLAAEVRDELLTSFRLYDSGACAEVKLSQLWAEEQPAFIVRKHVASSVEKKCSSERSEGPTPTALM